MKVFINGFGRIGRSVLRAAMQGAAPGLEVVGINDIAAAGGDVGAQQPGGHARIAGDAVLAHRVVREALGDAEGRDVDPIADDNG